MARSWVKSLQCKTRAHEDVYHPKPKTLIQSGSCRQSVQSLKDVIDTKTTSKRHSKKPDPDPDHRPPPVPRSRIRAHHEHSGHPLLTELPSGHPSRNVVEIIFQSGWSPKAFTGRVEVIFKVQNGPRAAARFHEYRDAVMSRVGSGDDPKENARCAADGNEVMGFHCLGPASPDGSGGGWAFPGGGKAAICTYSASGGAHESGGGGGRGVRAMLVCRVVAGRVGFDSVGGDGGELLVFDSRAVLPCFLIIYKL